MLFSVIYLGTPEHVPKINTKINLKLHLVCYEIHTNNRYENTLKTDLNLALYQPSIPLQYLKTKPQTKPKLDLTNLQTASEICLKICFALAFKKTSDMPYHLIFGSHNIPDLPHKNP
jgi:hypothetical protein